MKRKIIAFGMALLVFAGSSMTALAGTCPHPNAQDGMHYYICGPNYCRSQNWGEVKDQGWHKFFYGYDEKGNPIFGPECRMTQSVEYYRLACINCVWSIYTEVMNIRVQFNTVILIHNNNISKMILLEVL